MALIEMEIGVMKTLGANPYIVQYLGSVRQQLEGGRVQFYILMECCGASKGSVTLACLGYSCLYFNSQTYLFFPLQICFLHHNTVTL